MKKIRLISLMLTITVLTTLFISPDDTDALAQDEVIHGTPPPPDVFANVEHLLVTIARFKFSELESYWRHRERFNAIRELYVPIVAWNDPYLYEVRVSSIPSPPNPPSFITFISTGATGYLEWTMGSRTNEEPSSPVQTGAWYFVHPMFRWVQYGHTFSTTLSQHLEETRFYEFFTPVSVDIWEIRGNAMSVSVQGMEHIGVFDALGNRLIGYIITHEYGRIGLYMEVYTLFRLNNDGATDRIGYRWLIDEESRRYQFVLEPGVYTFLAEGIIGEQDLLIRHFSDHEVISETNYAATLAQQPGRQFILTVDGLAAEHNLRLAENMARLSLTLGSPVITDQNSGATLIMDAIPQLEDGRTLVPIRFIAEGLGADVLWDKETQTVTIKLDEQVISLTIGELGDGMDVPARLFDGRTMVPLRFVAERLGAIVTWDSVTESIEIIR